MLLARDFFPFPSTTLLSHFISLHVVFPFPPKISIISFLSRFFMPQPALTFLVRALRKYISLCTYSFGSKLPGMD